MKKNEKYYHYKNHYLHECTRITLIVLLNNYCWYV